jgi:hypothetical protein
MAFEHLWAVKNRFNLEGPLKLKPISHSLGAAALVHGAAYGGYKLGEFADRKWGISDTASSFYADRTPRAMKWWIHKYF